MGRSDFKFDFCICFTVDLLMQHELRCVNVISRISRTWKSNRITSTYLIDGEAFRSCLLFLVSMPDSHSHTIASLRNSRTNYQICWCRVGWIYYCALHDASQKLQTRLVIVHSKGVTTSSLITSECDFHDAKTNSNTSILFLKLVDCVVLCCVPVLMDL